ncbi:MAG: endosialidase [Lachnospiraceae bacterium]|jgi:hypothetical protein|nr:endosialidase [Lachnospiraceae bacterium]
MSVVKELLCSGPGESINFGNHKLADKAKKEDFEHGGSLWKVKTSKELTRLEKNGMFVYESVPGTSVHGFSETEEGLSFVVDGDEDAQITVDLTEATEYEVLVADESVGKMKTNLGGKLSFAVRLAGSSEVPVKIVK